jgi:myo-inositol-1(or 4)-monophosphatase
MTPPPAADPPRDQLLAWHDAARELARVGGHATRRWSGRDDLAIERKADHSPVTAADREAETRMRAWLAARFPDHAVVGEEHGGQLSGRGCEWVLDPIDGTRSFIRGVPLYTTLVALLVDGRPVVGVIHAPATGELVSAAVGCGAWDQAGRPVRVAATTSLQDAWVLTTDPANLSRREPRLSAGLLARCAGLRTWADGYGYLLLARGDADVMIDPELSPWDIAPLGVVVREAGGVLTDLAGQRDDLGASAVAAATGALHAAVLRLRG